MLDFGGGSKSTAKQITQSASDSGQNIGEKAKAIQGGSTNLEKGASQGMINLSGAKISKDSNIQFGYMGDVGELVSGVQTTTAQQIADVVAAGNASTAAQLGTIAQESAKQLDTITKVFGNKADSDAGNPKLIAWLGLGSLALLGLGLWLILRK